MSFKEVFFQLNLEGNVVECTLNLNVSDAISLSCFVDDLLCDYGQILSSFER